MPERDHRRLVPRLDHDERCEQGARGDQQPDRAAARPADVRRLRDRVHEECEVPGCGDRAARVEAAQAGDAALADERPRQREHERADRHVDEEDPLPAGVLREDAAHQHAGRGAAAGHGAPDPERLVALRALLERRRDDRERRRRDDRRADALHRARRDQDADGAGEPARERGGGEQCEPDHEHPPPPEQVGRAAAEQQQAAEGDRVCDEDPLEALVRDAERDLDRGQRDVDDRHVEHGHEHRDADERERLPAARVGCSVHVSPSAGFPVANVWRQYGGQSSSGSRSSGARRRIWST